MNYEKQNVYLWIEIIHGFTSNYSLEEMNNEILQKTNKLQLLKWFFILKLNILQNLYHRNVVFETTYKFKSRTFIYLVN